MIRPDVCVCCGQRLEWHAVPAADGSIRWVQRDPGGDPHTGSCTDNPFTAPRHHARALAELIQRDIVGSRG